MAGLRETTAAEQQEGAGYLVGDEVCALFAGALTFREQCVAAGILYKDLDSEGDSTTDDGGGKSMMLEDEAEEAEEDGRDVCAHVCSHNDRCEVCDDGGEALLPCDYCNLAYHTGCLAPPLIIAEGEDVAFACPLCVAGRRAGHEDTGVVAVGAPDAAVEAEARRARDEAVRREHAAIEGYRREQYCVSQSLGAGDASKVANLYSYKYRVKPLTDMVNSAAVFVAASREIRGASSASDTGTDARTAIHMAERSMNKGAKELCSTMAAAINIGAGPPRNAHLCILPTR